ncbi:hypothetical protein BVRB_1g004180 [Beta vulgaris subsp. vulgaris]|nr:hypothetical protein BVRB_1g004180 [Beta vulgaris subsp. vulgaris]
MATKVFLLFLALIIISVCASARTLPMVENHEASEPLRSQIEGGGKTEIEASVPLPRPMSTGGGVKMINGGYTPHYDGHEKQDGVTPNGDEKQDGIAKGMMDEKTDDGNGKLRPESTVIQPPSMPIGVIPILPGGAGSFHFGLGPIDFGGNIGWGGFSPGYVVSYSQPQPYVVVSPYSTPYPIPSPFLPPGSAYGAGQPSQGYSSSYPSVRGYAHVSSQIGGFASNGNN